VKSHDFGLIKNKIAINKARYTWMFIRILRFFGYILVQTVTYKGNKQSITLSLNDMLFIPDFPLKFIGIISKVSNSL
jgi:hypothetical protein